MKKLLVKESGFNAELIPLFGGKFLTGNGYMGVRGTLSEYSKVHLPCINLAGVYDQVGSDWRESVNAPNGLYAYLEADGVRCALPETEVSLHELTLDIVSGVLHRRTVFKTDKGNITLNSRRAVSMANTNLILEQTEIASDYNASLAYCTGIDADVWDIHGTHFVKTECTVADGWLKTVGTTGEKGTRVTTQTKAKTNFDAKHSVVAENKLILDKIEFAAEANESYIINKYIVVSTTEDKHELRMPSNFASELDAHIAAWNKIADESYIEVDGDDEGELALNYSLYHLNCIAPRHSKSMSIAARGLSGQVYKGAIFWDTEMFMIDYFLYSYPEIVKTLMMYRVDSLPGAKKKAAEYGYDGAFYAWESHEGGMEACSDFNIVDIFTKRPMRTYFRDKQVHVSAAIVFAIEKYVRIAGDTDFLSEGAAEVILECAKFYRSLLISRIGSEVYEIHDVLGPDEYHERVNNNAYTNRMAKFVFETVTNYAEYMSEDVTEYAELAKRLYIPQPNENGVIEQFDGYFKLEDCTIDEVRSRLVDPKEYWGGAYGVASDTQILKQADVVAMMSMFPQEYTLEEKKSNLEYYSPRTEHGSSLSACMYSLLACHVSDPDYAYPFFMKSAAVDLNQGSKQWAGLVYIGGTHPASAGGAWMVAVRGFAGMEIKDGKIVCLPNMPCTWKGMRFNINYRSKRYAIEVRRDGYDIKEI